MRVELREDSVVISGYINAVERESRPIRESIGGRIRTFVERIKAGVFGTALKRNNDVKVLLNHNPDRVLASTGDGTAELREDNIGLHGDITITDAEVVQKAREGKLSGWSFGFYANAVDIQDNGKMPLRTVTDLDLVEVSVLDDTKVPAYYGTSIEARDGDGKSIEIREDLFETEERNTEELANRIAELVVAKIKESNNKPLEDCGKDEKKREVDYSAFEQRLSKLKEKKEHQNEQGT